MSSTLTEMNAKITADTANVLAGLERVKKSTLDLGRVAQQSSKTAASSFDTMIAKADKFSNATAGALNAVYALEAQGSARVLSLGNAVGSVAGLLGPGGKLVQGVAIVGSAIAALFLQAKEKSADAMKSMLEDIRALEKAGNLRGLIDRQLELKNGDPEATDASRRFGVERARMDLIPARDRRDRLRNDLLSAEAAGKSRIALEQLRRELGAAEDAIRPAERALDEMEAQLHQVEQALKRATEADVSQKNELRKIDAAEDAQRAAQRYADTLRTLKQRAADLTETLAGVSGIQRAESDIAQWERDAIRAKVPIEEVREEVEKLYTELGKFRAREAKTLFAKSAELIAKSSGTAVSALRVELGKLADEAEALIKASDELGTQDGAINANRLRELLPVIEAQRESLERQEQISVAFAKSSRQAAAAVDLYNTAALNGVGPINARLIGTALLELRMKELTTQEAAARAEVARTTEGTKERAAAEKLLLDIEKEQYELRQRVKSAPKPELDRLVTNTIAIGEGLQSAAQAALSLISILGKGNTPLAQMVAAVGTIGDGVRRIGEEAKKAAEAQNSGKSYSTTAGNVAGVASIVGGIVSLGQAIKESLGDSPQVKSAREAMERNTDAVLALATEFGDYAASAISGRQLRAVSDGLASLFSQGRTPSNFANFGLFKIGQKYNDYSLGDSRLPDYIKIDPAEFLRAAGTSMKAVQEVANQLGVELDGTVGSFRKLSQALYANDFALLNNSLQGQLKRLELNSLIFGKAADPLDQIANKFRVLINLAPDLASLFNIDDLASAVGRTGLRDQVAAILRKAINLDPNSPEAREFYESLGGLSPSEFLDLFTGILQGLDGFSEAAEQTASALEEFSARAKIFGITGTDYVIGVIEALGKDFEAQFGDLLEGIDASTTDGIAAIRERLKARFDELSQDGITESEQEIVDAILSILGALDGLPAALDPLAQALEVFAVQVDTFGLSAAEQFKVLQGIFAEQFDGLDEILQAGSIETAAGRDALKARLQEAIAAILDDGVITDEERPYLEALQRFFGTVTDAIDDATAQAEDARRTRVAVSDRRVEGEISLGGVTGADALQARVRGLAGLSPLFAQLLPLFTDTSASGIRNTKDALFQLFRDITAGKVDIAQFGDLTEDEIIAKIIELGGNLDGLAESLSDAAKAAEEAAAAERQQTTDLRIRLAKSRGADTRLDEFDAAAQAERAAAVTAGRSASFLQFLDQVLASERTKLLADIAGEATSAAVAAAAAEVNKPAGAQTTEFVRNVGSITEVSAQTIAGYLKSIDANTRTTANAGLSMLQLLGGLRATGSIPIPSIPSFGASANGTLVIQNLTIAAPNVQAPAGVSATDYGTALGRAQVRAIDQALGRLNGVNVRFLGGQSR